MKARKNSLKSSSVTFLKSKVLLGCGMWVILCLFTIPLSAQTALPGSISTAQMLLPIQMDLQNKYYTKCDLGQIKPLELVSLEPAALLKKKVYSEGDKWTEVWKVDACGTIATHAMDFEMVNVGGYLAVSQMIHPGKPASATDNQKKIKLTSFDGRIWTAANKQKIKGGTFTEYTTGGESVMTWSQLLSVIDTSNSGLSIQTVSNAMKKQFASEGCPQKDLITFTNTAETVTFYRDYARCTQPSKESNVGRMSLHRDRLITILYAVRGSLNEQQAKAFADALLNIDLED